MCKRPRCPRQIATHLCCNACHRSIPRSSGSRHLCAQPHRRHNLSATASSARASERAHFFIRECRKSSSALRCRGRRGLLCCLFRSAGGTARCNRRLYRVESQLPLRRRGSHPLQDAGCRHTIPQSDRDNSSCCTHPWHKRTRKCSMLPTDRVNHAAHAHAHAYKPRAQVQRPSCCRLPATARRAAAPRICSARLRTALRTCTMLTALARAASAAPAAAAAAATAAARAAAATATRRRDLLARHAHCRRTAAAAARFVAAISASAAAAACAAARSAATRMLYHDTRATHTRRVRH